MEKFDERDRGSKTTDSIDNTHRVGIGYSSKSSPGSTRSSGSLSRGVELAELRLLLRAESRSLFALKLFPSRFPFLFGQILLRFILQQRVVFVVVINPVFSTLFGRD